ncbi:MAG: reprolysin-like metallopeptidase [Pseudomonadota bacterium]
MTLALIFAAALLLFAGSVEAARTPAGLAEPLQPVPVKVVELDGERLRLDLGDLSIEGVAEHQRRYANGDISLILSAGMRPTGEPAPGAMPAKVLGGHLTIGEAGTFGQLHMENGLRLIMTDATGTWSVDVPNQGVEINRCGMSDHIFGRPARTMPPTEARPENEAATVIDLLIIYNEAFGRRYPGALLTTRLNHLVDIANRTFGNSGLDAVIRLVGTEAVTYRNDNSNFDFRNDIAITLSGDEQPGLQGVAERRNELGADLVIGLRPHDIETRGSCGIAFFPENDAIFGVNVVSDGISSWSFCLDDVLTHEIGHNLGATHQVGAGGAFIDPTGAAFVQPGRFGTVMGSFGTGRPDRFRGLPMFSNPFLPCGGEPCGREADANNVGVMRGFLAEVGDYRAPTSSAPIPPARGRDSSDQDGDGVIDWADALPFDPTETTDRDRDGRGDRADAFPEDAQEQDDTDRDGVGNVADTDDDGDGVEDRFDAFPLDANEDTDSDRDGVGNNADRFVSDPDEFRDTDSDGLGDNSDTDDDNDGFNEFDADGEDLLVVSVDSRQILRFDAENGQSRGVEVPAWDSRLTFQTRMAWRQSENTLLYTGDSGLRRISLLDRELLGEWVPAYNDEDFSAPQLGTGFPVGLGLLEGGRRVVVSRLGNPLLATFQGQEAARNESTISWQLDPDEEPGDLAQDQDEVFVLGLTTRSIYAIDQFGPRLLAGPNLEWMRKPTFIEVAGDDRLLVSDQGRNSVVALDRRSGEFLGDFIRFGPLGFNRPAGLAVSSDGTLFVGAARQDAILAFDAETGDFEGIRAQGAGLNQPGDLVLVPSLIDRFPGDPDRLLKPNPGLWSDPASDGRGFDIQVFGSRLSVIWYTYDDAGEPTWYLAAGDLVGDRFEAPLQRFTLPGGDTVAGDLGVTASSEVVGDISLRFVSERIATVDWSVNGVTGQESLSWLVFTAQVQENNPTGLWGRPDGPGWGLSLASQGNITVSVAYVYDTDGTPRWSISEPVQGPSPSQFDMLVGFAPGLCPGCSSTEPARLVPGGVMELRTDNEAVWNSDIAWPMPLQGSWRLEAVPSQRASEPAQRPR